MPHLAPLLWLITPLFIIMIMFILMSNLWWNSPFKINIDSNFSINPPYHYWRWSH